MNTCYQTVLVLFSLALMAQARGVDYKAIPVEPSSREDSIFIDMASRVEAHFPRNFFVYPEASSERRGLVAMILNEEMNSLETLNEVMFCFVASRPAKPDFINEENVELRAPITRDIIGGEQTWLIDPAALPEFRQYSKKFFDDYSTKISRQSHAEEYHAELSRVAAPYAARFDRFRDSIFETNIRLIQIQEEHYIFDKQQLIIHLPQQLSDDDKRRRKIMGLPAAPETGSLPQKCINEVKHLSVNVPPESAEIIIESSKRGKVTLRVFFKPQSRFMKEIGFGWSPQHLSYVIEGIEMNVESESIQMKERWKVVKAR